MVQNLKYITISCMGAFGKSYCDGYRDCSSVSFEPQGKWGTDSVFTPTNLYLLGSEACEIFILSNGNTNLRYSTNILALALADKLKSVSCMYMYFLTHVAVFFILLKHSN